MEIPEGFVSIELGKQGGLGIRMRMYLAGLALGKTLPRRQAHADRLADQRSSS